MISVFDNSRVQSGEWRGQVGKLLIWAGALCSSANAAGRTEPALGNAPIPITRLSRCSSWQLLTLMHRVLCARRHVCRHRQHQYCGHGRHRAYRRREFRRQALTFWHELRSTGVFGCCWASLCGAVAERTAPSYAPAPVHCVQHAGRDRKCVLGACSSRAAMPFNDQSHGGPGVVGSHHRSGAGSHQGGH